MTDLHKALADMKAARFKYPQHRRESEDKFWDALVDFIEWHEDRFANIEEELKRRRGGRPKVEEAA